MRIWHFLKHGKVRCDLQNSRDKDGKLVRRCVLCGSSREVLSAELVKDGPAKQLARTHGEPKTVVNYPDRKDNVTAFRQSER